MHALLILALTLAGVPSTSEIGGPARETTMAFVPGPQGGVIVPVFLNGQGPFRFLLDTGSTHSAVSEGLAVRLGAPAVARTVIASALGSREQLVISIDRLDCGPLGVTGLLPSVVNLHRVDPHADIQGVLGQDVLAGVRYTIDFKRHQLHWWPRDRFPADGTAFPLEARGGRFVVPLAQSRGVLRLVPDSGATGMLLFEQDDQQMPPMTVSSELIGMKTMTAGGMVRQVVLRELRIGPARLRDVPAVLVPRDPNSAGTDGLLPLHLFDWVTFDGPRRLLILPGGA